MKILIVDDEIEILQNFLKDIIAENDLEYKFFSGGKNEILFYCTHNKFDAAFLDINMPSINGLDLASFLIDVNPEIKIVFITGLAISEKDLTPKLKLNTLGFLYKPFDLALLKNYLNQIRDITPRLFIKTFGSFDCLINDEVVRFSSSKSKELFALLAVYNGNTLTMDDAISQIWPDTNLDNAKKLYRDAVWRLRKALNDINFNCVEFQRAALKLIKNNIECDYWTYLKTKEGPYNGEFLKSYDWSIDYQAQLDKIAGF